jgi:hypothetical protein
MSRLNVTSEMESWGEDDDAARPNMKKTASATAMRVRLVND